MSIVSRKLGSGRQRARPLRAAHFIGQDTQGSGHFTIRGWRYLTENHDQIYRPLSIAPNHTGSCRHTFHCGCHTLYGAPDAIA